VGKVSSDKKYVFEQKEHGFIKVKVVELENCKWERNCEETGC